MTALTTTTKSGGLRELDALEAECRAAVRVSVRLPFDDLPIHTAAEADRRLAKLQELAPDPERLAALARRVEDGLTPATAAEIGQHVAALLGAFPASTAPDPDVYSRMVVEEIKAAEPSRLALDTACRKLRRTLKWAPAIVEALEALKDAEAAWRFRARHLREMPEAHARVTAAIRDTRDKVRRIEQERAAAQPQNAAQATR